MDSVRDLRHHGEVVRDVDCGAAAGANDIAYGVEDLDLRRYVKRRRRLVENQELGIARQGHGQHDSLLLASARLMRITGGEHRRLWKVERRQ